VSVLTAPYGLLAVVADRAHSVDDLARALAADVDATFPRLVEDYGDTVYGLALRTAGPQSAEDLAAETFLRAYAALRRYPAQRIRELAVRPWLVTILLNHWRNEQRSRHRRPAERPLEEESAAQVADAAPGPEATATLQDAASRVMPLVNALPHKQRLALLLRHVGELSYAEIGAVLKVPEGTAKSHVARGLAAVRAQASELGLEDLLP
jgi:RNA polymerase sigma factor (sigma-70 family)